MIRTIAKGVTLNCLHTDRFKEMCISVNFFSKSEKKGNAERALLSMMLVDRCKAYPTKKEMTKICDHLFGCTLGSRVVSYGKAHCLEIRSKMINPIYIHENHNSLNDWMNFISEVIFNPIILDENENKSVFEENKKILTARIKRREDDAQSYTVSRALEQCPKSLGIRVRGDEQTIRECRMEDVLAQYEKMINENQIEIVVCGEFDENELVKKILNVFDFKDRSELLETHYVVDGNDLICSKENKDQPQSNIAQVYASGIDVKSDLYPALKVANGILGQLPSSFLFQVIREQHSLCYSIVSNLISYDGAYLITTGIEKENIEKTLELIEEQIERCKKGDFSEELVETTKKMLVSSLKNSQDEMSSILGYALNNRILKRDYPMDKNIEEIMKVTKDDCIKVFNKMKHLSTYITAGGKESYE